MKLWGLLMLLGMHGIVYSQETQSFKFNSQPTINGTPIELNVSYANENGSLIQFSSAKYYLSHFEFIQQNEISYAETDSYHLVDLENPESSSWEVVLPLNLRIDQIKLYLGIDSLTNVSGAMGGDLDPTLGMYWTWQSGYINVKLEGVYNGEEFIYHLGGYSGKMNALQCIEINKISNEIRLELELSPLFSALPFQSVMSPGEQAVEMSSIIAESILIYE